MCLVSDGVDRYSKYHFTTVLGSSVGRLSLKLSGYMLLLLPYGEIPHIPPHGNGNFLKLLLQPIHCNRDVFATAPSSPSSSFRAASAVPTSSSAATFRFTVYIGVQLPPYECSSLQLVQVYIVGSMFAETVRVLPDFYLKVDIAAVLTVYLERL